MAKINHTSGPWELLEGGNFIYIGGPGYLALEKAQGNLSGGICALSFVYGDKPSKHLPNARLIVAAPDLLAALRTLLPCVYNDDEGRFDRQVWIARKAIAKATAK